MANISERWQELKSQAASWLAEGAKDLHNQIVPAFPSYVHGVDQPGTPLNMPHADKPSFEQSLATQAPASPDPAKAAEQGIDL